MVPVPEPDPEPVRANPRRSGCGGTFLGLVIILAVLAGFVFYRVETFPSRVRDAFAAVTGVQPRVTVNEHVVFEQSSPVLQLAVLEREMVVERETTDTWLGSTKHLRVRGTFRVKAGFDLTQPFSVNIDGALAQTIRVHLPPPRLLSVELERLETPTVDSGLWNPVQPEEFAEEVNALNTEARLKANQQGMMAEAKKTFAAQLKAKLGSGHRVELSTSTSDPQTKK